MNDSVNVEAEVHFLKYCIQWSSIALIYYDYVIKFPSEVKYIWTKKFRLSTWLYFLCHYYLIANTLFLIEIPKDPKKISTYGSPIHVVMLSSRQYPFNSCVASLYINTSSIVGRAAVITTQVLRTYHIFTRSRLVLFTLGSLGFSCILVDSLQVPWKKCSPDTLSLSGLTVLLTTIIRDLEANDLLTAGSLLSIMMTVFEALVAALTVRCSIRLLHVGNTWGINRHHLSTLVLKQGLSYFFLTAIFTISSVVLNFREQRGSFAQHFPNALVLPVSCILTTRFILRLKEWKDRDVIHDTLVISESQSGIPRSLPITFAERLDDFVLKEFDDSLDNSCIQSTALEM